MRGKAPHTAVVPDKCALRRAQIRDHREMFVAGWQLRVFAKLPPVAMGPGSALRLPGTTAVYEAPPPHIDSPCQVGEKRGRDDSP